jgi:hypothetical protein
MKEFRMQRGTEWNWCKHLPRPQTIFQLISVLVSWAPRSIKEPVLFNVIQGVFAIVFAIAARWQTSWDDCARSFNRFWRISPQGEVHITSTISTGAPPGDTRNMSIAWLPGFGRPNMGGQDVLPELPQPGNPVECATWPPSFRLQTFTVFFFGGHYPSSHHGL